MVFPGPTWLWLSIRKWWFTFKKWKTMKKFKDRITPHVNVENISETEARTIKNESRKGASGRWMWMDDVARGDGGGWRRTFFPARSQFLFSRRYARSSLRPSRPGRAATQNEANMLQVLQLPRKRRLLCSKCCACHAKRAGAQSTQLSPDFR